MKEISIRELGYNFLLKWKRMVVIIICCMIAFVAYQSLNKKTNNEMQEISGDIFTAEELSQIEECYNAFLDYEAAVKYRDEAVIMQIDPFHVNKVVNEYIITCEDYENLQSLVNSYSYYVSSGAAASKITEEGEDLSDLITATVGEADIIGQPAEGKMKATVMVEVIHEDEESARNLSNKIDSEIADYCKELNQKIGSHTIECVMQEHVTGSHNTLISWQSQMRSAAINEKNIYESKRNSLSAMQLSYMESAYFGEDTVNSQAEQPVLTNIISVKMLILDFAAAVLIAILYSVIVYILSGKIYNPRSVEATYGLRTFGVLPVYCLAEQGKIRKNILQRMYHLNAEGKQDEYLEIICNNIKYFAQKQGMDKIFIETEESEERDYIQKMIRLLKEQNISCTVGTNITGNSNEMEELRKLGNMVFIKKSGEITYKQLEKELNVCEINEINVLGVIFVV